MVDPICMKPFQSFSFQTKMSNIVNKYIFLKNISTTLLYTTVVKFHEKPRYDFDLLASDYNIFKKIIHSFHVIPSSHVHYVPTQYFNNIFEPFKQINTLNKKKLYSFFTPQGVCD